MFYRTGTTRLLLSLAATLIALPAVWVLLTRGLPVIADDTPVHLMRLYLFDQHVRAGDLLPRWLPELYTGYGYPLFTFYAPAMYYVAEWLHLAGLSLVGGYRFTYALAVIAGAIGAAFLGAALYEGDRETKRLRDREIGREVDKESARQAEQKHRASPDLQSPISNLLISQSLNLSIFAGLLAATAYTYTLYLLANVYVRGAFGEVGAQALLPWLFWAWRSLVIAPRRVALLALSAGLLALLAVTHTITFLLALPGLVSYVVILAVVERKAVTPLTLRLAAPAGAALLAALLSAVIWLPQLLERSNLSAVAWSTPLLLDNLWRWRDFVELDLRFRAVDGGQTPYQLGAVQVWLLLAGLIFTRRRTAEWWFWVGVLGISVLLMSPLSAPLWASVQALAIIQFPWRLLGIAGLAAALIGAGVVTAFPTPTARAISVPLLIAFIVITQAPRAAETPHLVAPVDITLSPASITRFEVSEPAYGASYDDEFLPRWANPAALLAPTPAAPPVDANVTLDGARNNGIQLAVETQHPFPLRWRQFYFPQMDTVLDAATPLTTTPDMRTGLVEVSVPAGAHTVAIRRNATPSQQAGLALTLAGFVLLMILAVGVRKTLVMSAVAALVIGPMWIGGAQSTATLAQTPTVDLPLATAPGLDLLDISTTLEDAGRLQLAPTWFVHSSQPDLLAHWKVVAADGDVASEIQSAPRFGVWRSSAWTPGEVVQDAVELALPPGLSSGAYTVTLSLVDANSGAVLLADQNLLEIELSAMPAVELTHAPDVTFGQLDAPVATLDGLRVTVNGKPVQGQFVAMPGDTVTVDLRWQPLTSDRYPYQSIVEIVDTAQRKVAAQDLQVGWRDSVLDLWNPYLAPHEHTTLRLPDDAASGLYTLRVGLRDRRNDGRLTAFDPTGAPQGDFYAASEFKVLAPLDRRPATHLAAMFGETIALDGYTVSPAATVRPGDTLTVTLFYRARADMPADYTRFLQLHSPAHGMAAQADAMPQEGANPTSAWVTGERIADTAVLHVAPDATPGTYRLLLGFYDAANGGMRLPATDKAGAPLPDQAVVLAEITIGQ